MGFLIRVSIKSLLTLLPLLFAGIGFSQSINLVPYSRAVQTPDSINYTQALALFKDSENPITGNTAFGFSQNYFWILIDVPGQVQINQGYVLDVDNPHIDHIAAYRISSGNGEFLGQSGDRIPFYKRTYENRRNIFHVKFEAANEQLLILVDKRNASVTVPLKLWQLHEFERDDSKSNMVYGIYFGMLLLIVMYSILIYVMQGSSIYLWYGLYVLSLFIYLFTLVGYGFQFLFPNQYEWSNYLRLIMIVLMVVAQIRFTQLFLPVKLVAPMVNLIYNGIVVALVGIILWWLLVPGLFTAYTIVVINVVYGIMTITVLLLCIALYRSWKTAKTSSLFYSTAFFMNVVAAILMIAEEYGVVNISSFLLPPLFIGSFFEILIFAVGLSYRAKLIVDDRKKLMTRINSLRQQALQAFVRGMEEEKVRIANELHDDVASRLSLLKMKAANNSECDLTNEIAEISLGVRNISHQLNPISLNSETLLQKINELISENRLPGLNIEYRFFDMKKPIPEDVGLQLYRILQEALHNIQKHAKAQQVDVQMFVHDSELILTIEDDGIGFDMERQKFGLGTKNMRIRTEQLGGEFSLSSAVGDGTSIMISIPFH